MKEKINKYWWPDGHLNENQKDFLIDTLIQLKPKNCLEIGFASGRSCVTTLVVAEPELLISVDINLDYNGARKNAENLLNDFKNLKIVEGDSLKLLDAEFFRANFPYGIDFAFIDGGHTYDCAYNDVSNVYKYMNTNSIMIVDDYYSGAPDGCSLPDVNRAVDNFVSENNIKIEKWNKSGKGFAIIKK